MAEGLPPNPVGGVVHERRSQGVSPIWRGVGGASLGQPLRAPPLQAPLLQLRPQHRVLALQLLHLREGGRLETRGRGFGGGGGLV